MNIPFDPDDEAQFIELQSRFNELGEDALSYSHHELATITGIDSQAWKEFLMDTRVSDYLKHETDVMIQVKYRKAIKDLDTNSKSYGAAQVFNALAKANEKDEGPAEGPTFVYCYIPLSKEEKQAGNIKTVHKDPFKVEVADTPTIVDEIVNVDITDSHEYL